jgi:hypothetical protein
MAGNTPHESSILGPENSVAGASSTISMSNFMSASSWSYTVSFAKGFTNVIFVIAVVVKWLRLINWWRPVDGPYLDSIISLGLILASLIEFGLHLLKSLLQSLNRLLKCLELDSQRSLPIMSCVV